MIDVVVRHKRDEAEGICSFELEACDGSPLPPFEPGAHIDVHLPAGIIRPYSLCPGDEQQGRYLIAVLREPTSRGGSTAMHTLRDGDRLRIGLPRNHFPLDPGASRSVLLAGGIGITPMLAMAEHLAARGSDFVLHYCARSAAQILNREPALLGRCVRRERDLERRADPIMLANERHNPIARDRLVRIARNAHGLGPRGPILTTLEIANVQRERIRLARAVRRAPRDRQRPEVRAPRSVVRDRQPIAVVGQLMLGELLISIHCKALKVRLIVAGRRRTSTSLFAAGVTLLPSTRALAIARSTGERNAIPPGGIFSEPPRCATSEFPVARMSKSTGPYGVPSARTFTPGASRTHFSAIPAPITSALSCARSYAKMSSTERM